ncbi:MAG: MaoC family dehydratase [Chloroflexi bacterium]|nr:MaoC family dehydratase [Chloroflexota bacterium]
MSTEASEAPAVAPVSRLIDQARVDAYATAARDHNPIHRVGAEASASQFGRPIAHGMLVLALVSEAMAAAFGERWARGGTLKVRWRAPAIPPVTVTARATARAVTDGLASYDVVCETESGEPLLTGTATAPLA